MKITKFKPDYGWDLGNTTTLGSSVSGDASGSLPGPITVTGINGVAVSGTGIAGDVLTLITPTTADWEAPTGGSGFVTNTLGGKEVYQTIAASGATHTLDLANGNGFDLTLTASCVLTFAGATAATMCSFMLLLRQNGTGGWVTTWPGSVIWAGGVAPTLDTTASTAAVLTFFTLDGGTVWYGFPTGGGGSVSPLTTKGDLYTYSTVDTRLGVGADGRSLLADSGQTTGLRWSSTAPVGPILISDTPSTPLVFADLLQNDPGTDLLYADL
jgi:hypothetical protein